MRSLIILSLITLIISCNRKGCTDPTSLNYDSKAKRDDGSCISGLIGNWYFVNGTNMGNPISFTTSETVITENTINGTNFNNSSYDFVTEVYNLPNNQSNYLSTHTYHDSIRVTNSGTSNTTENYKIVILNDTVLTLNNGYIVLNYSRM